MKKVETVDAENGVKHLNEYNRITLDFLNVWQ